MQMTIDSNAISERRVDRRRRALKGAVLRFNRGFGTMEGVVRNESENGTLLSFGDATGVLEELPLDLLRESVPPHDHRGAESRQNLVRIRADPSSLARNHLG